MMEAMRTFVRRSLAAWLALVATGCAYDWDALRAGGGASSSNGCEDYPNAQFCSGFESGDLSDWSLPGGADRPSIIEDAAFGDYAAKVETPGFGSSGYVDAQVNASGQAIYGRAYYFLPSSVEVSHFQALDVYENPSFQIFTVLFLGDNRAHGWSGNEGLLEGSVELPRDQWFCLRFEAHYGSSGSLKLWVNDEVSVDTTADLRGSGVQFVSMPARYTHDAGGNEQGPVEIWFDEVVFDDEPVTCL